MLDRNKTILTAAADVFTRYGVKRATMNDIASEAGVARQTLYNAFDNKEAIIRALIQAHIEETCEAISVHISDGGSLSDGLELAFDQFARKPYRLLRETPHGGEIMDAMEDAAGDEMTESKERFKHAVAELFHPYSDKLSAQHMTADALADFIVITSMGHKAKATSMEHLESLLATLKRLVVGVVE